MRKVVCSKCSRVIPIEESSEYNLVRHGALVEFFYCADRTDCEKAKAYNASIDAEEQAALRLQVKPDGH